jgi:hypothetical protein
MLRRLCCFVALVASLLAAGGKQAVACDRAVAVVQSQVFGFAPAQVASPIVVAPLAVAPLTVVPLEAPLVGVQVHGRGDVALRAVRVAARPVMMKPSRARSVTRVRTIVR